MISLDKLGSDRREFMRLRMQNVSVYLLSLRAERAGAMAEIVTLENDR